MKRLIVLMLLPFLLFGGGAIDFDGSDYYNCGTVNFEPDDDDTTFVAWVTPNFTSADAGTYVIFSTIDLSVCPPLPPNCTGVTCGSGYGLWWDGANTRFLARFAEIGRCGGIIQTYLGCAMTPAFGAGDLVGIFANFRDGIQQCEAVVPAGTGATGSAFFAFDLLHSSQDLLVGAAPASHTGTSIGLEWEGSIDMLVLGDGRVRNSDNNYLVQRHKRSWFPQFSGTHALNGDGGTDPFDYIFSSDFMQGNDGDTVSTLLPQVGANCSGTGDPSATLTRMMY